MAARRDKSMWVSHERRSGADRRRPVDRRSGMERRVIPDRRGR